LNGGTGSTRPSPVDDGSHDHKPTTTKLVLTLRRRPHANDDETTTAGAQYYVVQSGDTLGSIAQKYGTTWMLDDPQPGSTNCAAYRQRIRVK